MPPTPTPSSRPPTSCSVASANSFSFGQAAAEADPLPASVRSSVALSVKKSFGHLRHDSGHADGDGEEYGFQIGRKLGEVTPVFDPQYDCESDTLPGGEEEVVVGKAAAKKGLDCRGEAEDDAWVDADEVEEEEEEEEEEDLGDIVEESWLFDGVLERDCKRRDQKVGKGLAETGLKNGGNKAPGPKRVRHGSMEERPAGCGTRVWIGYD
ncbi:hypothetical protein SLS57_002539 [Botryosphaeria dothidea]